MKRVKVDALLQCFECFPFRTATQAGISMRNCEAGTSASGLKIFQSSKRSQCREIPGSLAVQNCVSSGQWLQCNLGQSMLHSFGEYCFPLMSHRRAVGQWWFQKVVYSWLSSFENFKTNKRTHQPNKKCNYGKVLMTLNLNGTDTKSAWA